VSPDTLAQKQGGSNWAVTAVLAMHVLFGIVWFVIWFVSSYFTSFSGNTVSIFLVATISWLAAVPVLVWRWRRGSRWYGLIPVGWLFVFGLATEWGRPSELFFPW
jgi:hypothetical protein